MKCIFTNRTIGNDIIFYWYQFSIGTNSIFPCDLAKYNQSPLNEMHIHQQNHRNDIIFYWYQFSIGPNSIFPCDLAKYNLSPLNEMHIHQQNHWNDIIFYWYQSYHWYQWTIGIALYPARSHEKII